MNDYHQSDGHPVIEVRDLVKVYPFTRPFRVDERGDFIQGAGVSAVRGVSFTIRRGDFVSIMGASGSGKSTLLHVLGCLHQPSRGQYLLEGRPVQHLSDEERSALRARRIGVVFQKFNLLGNYALVGNVALPLVYLGMGRPEREARARAVLEAVGLGDRLDHRPSELSGGQEQRVAIARALVADPAILLADEPTGNLDSTTGRQIMGILQALHRAGRTIVQVTHDHQNARYGQRIITLRDGRIDREEKVEDPLTAEEFSMPVPGAALGEP